MTAAVENVRVSQRAKDQMVKLKRTTGILHWNVLCRWGFCLSLAEEGVPPETEIPIDSNVEMTWRVFGGRLADVYMALLKERLRRDGLPLDSGTLAKQFRLHLHRGISYLSDGRAGLDDMIGLAVGGNGSPTAGDDPAHEAAAAKA